MRRWPSLAVRVSPLFERILLGAAVHTSQGIVVSGLTARIHALRGHPDQGRLLGRRQRARPCRVDGFVCLSASQDVLRLHAVAGSSGETV